MPKSSPILGYPSTKAAVLAMLLKGMNHHEILALLRAEGSTTSLGYILNLKRCTTRGVRKALRLSVAEATLTALTRAALLRGIHARLLAEELLDLLAKENLIDNILDDGITTPKIKGTPNA